MFAVSSSNGLTLIFENEKDLKTVIKQLQGQLEWVQSEDVPPPYLYCRYDNRIPYENNKSYLEKLKDHLRGLSLS